MVSYFVLSGCCLLEICSFLERKQMACGPGREERGQGETKRSGGRGNVVEIHCIREESISNKNRKSS